MITLLDGPVAGTYMVKRAPLFLRAVEDTASGEKDVLDQLDDEPKATEKVKGRMSFFKRLSWQNSQPVAAWEDIIIAKKGEG